MLLLRVMVRIVVLSLIVSSSVVAVALVRCSRGILLLSVRTRVGVVSCGRREDRLFVAGSRGHDVIEITACAELLETREGSERQVVELLEDEVAVRTPMLFRLVCETLQVAQAEI